MLWSNKILYVVILLLGNVEHKEKKTLEKLAKNMDLAVLVKLALYLINRDKKPR
ncbi:uncharacterized protein G6M90_00g107310 [Metarhizium brunneum]|uniref:Uncharacterized protein n=1 Tax=Metarhizium brunneum TaxID=500148 RepID=A0A7D5ZEE5_9HYPO|nr:hypothetical protein G6M90_00g107310 [Metarhizium brunneum]